MPEVNNSPDVDKLYGQTFSFCVEWRHDIVTPEHMLRVLLEEQTFVRVLQGYADVETLRNALMEKLTQIDRVPKDMSFTPEISEQMRTLLSLAYSSLSHAESYELTIPHLVNAMMELEESWAAYLLNRELGENKSDFLSDLITAYAPFESSIQEEETSETDDFQAETAPKNAWKSLVTCINEQLANHNPLIGREEELQRTMLVLCRKEKNNPLHVGEPGVGKTALIYGLAQRIEDGQVPESLKHSRIYQLDLGGMLAGTQYRGDFEKRIKTVMDGVRSEGNAIVYIDEIHNLIGAGRTGDGSMDASNMLKPYLEGGDIRFIGSTTYEEYNRYLSRSGGILRRFQQIDIPEPTQEEALLILKGLKKRFEDFHHVTYTDEALERAVNASAQYINERRLPDKAIDLIDEAGAWAQMHQDSDVSPSPQAAVPPQQATQIGVEIINDILQKTCKISAAALTDDNNQQIETLQPRMLARIFGQDEAVQQVVSAVQMAKAGLLDEQKPLASLLFVGPTGVGKTEVARVLAQELGIQLVRFDMSEYTEKHTVAKLIGAPAGYVGYDDGGLLTDAIRKTPNCVLLLDELEKAHSDIYNVLLQVMDYASLTDNKGRKADFRNTVIIMTSNAGAQYAGQHVGFQSGGSRGQAMLKQVKRTFKPEFLNRLSATVVFRDLDSQMASSILDKKIDELQQKLQARQITLTLSPEARDYLLKAGFTPEYGAREIDRAIASQLKPLLMREILFGSLKNGGHAILQYCDDKLSLTTHPS